MKHLLFDYKKTRLIFLVIFVALFPVKSIAQEEQKTYRMRPNAAYTFSSKSSVYSPLNGGQVIEKLASTSSVSDKLPIGFSFQFGCDTYTDFYASSHGTLSFNQPFFTQYNTASRLTDDLTLLAPLWDNLSGIRGGTFSYRTTGTAPNRVFTAEWRRWRWRWNADSPNISFQIKLYEGTNAIEYIYNREVASFLYYPAAAIGLFNGFGIAEKQLWLNNTSANPVASTDLINNINILPASGQVYRFTRNDNENSCEMEYYGKTIINGWGGTNANNGLRIVLSGAANMQIMREGKGQIFDPANYLPSGTSQPYWTPGASHGVALSVGNTYFTGGTMIPKSGIIRLEVISSTKQSLIESPAGHFVNEIKLAAVKNGLTYYLTIKYIYDFPDNHFYMDYIVTIPKGNTEEVKFAHGWDTYLQGNDRGPGFVNGTAPNLLVGVTRTPSYEAFEYVGGVPWSGYFSAGQAFLNGNLGAEMTFKNTINADPRTDNGIGISINFGKTPGSFTSSNKLVFACDAGDVAPRMPANGVICKGKVLDLNSFITSPTPPTTVLVWKNSNGEVIKDPTKVAVAGSYSAYYYSSKYSCQSPAATITITLDTTCGICYKSGNVNGTRAGFLTIISTLDRKNHPAVNPRSGALILESKEKGFAISKIASPETTIAVPVEGMLVFDTTSKCLKLYNGTTWNCMAQTCVDND